MSSALFVFSYFLLYYVTHRGNYKNAMVKGIDSQICLLDNRLFMKESHFQVIFPTCER